MTRFSLLRYLSIEPVQLNRREKAIASFAGGITIMLTALLSRNYSDEQSAILVASMGASAAIVFAIPGSPLAQPWPFIGGQLLSAVVGVLCAAAIDDRALAAGTAAGLAILIMLTFRCLHPPGAATALAPILSPNHPLVTVDWHFVWTPVGINVAFLLILAILINRWLLRRSYPQLPSPKTKPQTTSQTSLVGVGREEVEQVARRFEHFLDIGSEELLRLFTDLQVLAFQKRIPTPNCATIMRCDIVTVEYATEVETAWHLMHKQRLTVLPVLDRKRHVIGIVTRYDFLKNLKLTHYHNFQEAWLTFIKSTPDVNTNKPEAIGHIMTRKVKTLPAQASIAELLPLIVDEGHHHVPIVDDDGRFLGVVFQSRLLAELFNGTLTHNL